MKRVTNVLIELNMFISKQFRNFVRSKSVLHDCIFEVTRAHSIQISSILEISSKKFVAHQKLDLLCSRMNAKDFSLECRQIVYYVTTVFARKLIATQFAKFSIQLCITQQLLQREMFFVKNIA